VISICGIQSRRMDTFDTKKINNYKYRFFIFLSPDHDVNVFERRILWFWHWTPFSSTRPPPRALSHTHVSRAIHTVVRVLFIGRPLRRIYAFRPTSLRSLKATHALLWRWREPVVYVSASACRGKQQCTR